MTAEDMVSGLEILCKYSPRGKDASIEGQHDVVMFDPRVTLEMVSEEDIIKLDTIGWYYSDHEYQCWCHFT